MRRKRIAVLMASIDREYQQNFAFGLASAGSEYGIDVCIFNSQGHTNVEIFSTVRDTRMLKSIRVKLVKA